MNRPQFSHFGSIAPLLIHQYERYLPTAFDESLTLLQKVNLLIREMNRLGEISNDVVGQWNKVMEWLLDNGLQEEIENQLQKWYEDGTLADIINNEIFGELNEQIKNVVESFEQFKIDFENETKTLDLTKAKANYLFDLNLSKQTINQGLAFDEVNNQLFATQAFTVDGDLAQSFYLNRLTMSGKLLDSMLVRHGGHGTSFGIEVENGQVFVWSNIMKTSVDGKIATQWLARFPYIANAEINSDSSNVVKYKEFPDLNYYQSAVCDNKNGLIALRITDSRNGLDSHMELYNIADVKNRSFVKQGEFHFTNAMNNSTLQGIAIDGTNAYISFGMSVNEYVLYHADLINNEVVGTYNNQSLVIQQANGSFEFNVSEPEGLFLYTDPKTKHKTLFQVIVSSAPQRRRNRLYAISSNDGYLKFVGNALEFAQLHPLTLNDGKAKPVDLSYSRLDYLTDTGEYYLATSDSNHYTDFPMPNVGGWWLTVSAKDSGGGVLQTLRRNSSVHSTTFKRIITGEGVATQWEGLPVRPQFENGFADYYEEENRNLKVMYFKTDNTLHIQGIIKPPSNFVPNAARMFVLPSGYRPSVRQAFLVPSSNGIMEMMVDSDGEVWLSAQKVGEGIPNSVHLNVTVGLNGIE